MTTTVMVVDDEPLARRKLACFIAQVDWARQIGEASDGMSAIDEIRRLRPQVVFLDIQMPELSGIQVVDRLRTLESLPVVVFTTAHDQYAVAAFELQAVDYLLKPFGQDRFLSALARARQAVAMQDAAAELDRARKALAGERAPLERIFVRDGRNVLSLLTSGIERFEAQDDYVMVHMQERRHLVTLRIGDIEERLPQPPFLRVHRSHIVNLDHVDRLMAAVGTHVEVRMKSGARIPVSRARAQAIRCMTL